MATISFEAQSYFKKYNQLVWPTVTVFLVVILSVTVLIPQAWRAYADFGGLGELRQKLGTLKSKAELLENMDTGELVVRTREVLIDVPSDEDLGYFVGSVRGTVEKSGATLLGVGLVGSAEVAAATSAATPIVSVSPSGAERFIPLNIQVGGSLTALRQFLADIDTSAPLSEMRSFSFGRTVEMGDFGGSVVINFYYSPVPASLGATEQPLPTITAGDNAVYEQLAQLKKPTFAEGALPEVATGQEEFMR